jgi:hypothetical protein
MFKLKNEISSRMADLMKNDYMYGIAIDGFLLTSSGYYGNSRNIPLYNSKESAQKEIDGCYSDRNATIKKLKVRIMK